DVGTVYEGFYGDAARTFAVGDVSPEAARLLRVTEESLALAVAEARSGNELNDIAGAVQKHAEGAGFHVVRRFVGHGIGSTLHEKPEVPNYVVTTKPALPLKTGMVLCIEPMITVGTPEVEILDDKWSAVTRDRSLAAHFEHCVAILPGGPQILDLP
ncbi:MAG: type I methionyl aminopeptidase, partial [Bilophila wadsworthia]